MKKWIANITIVFLASFIIFGCSNKEEIKIGAIFPLTGPAAKYGQNSKRGVELAVAIINNAGGIKDKKVTVIFEDSQAQPSIGVNAVKKLINVNKVPVVIGPLASSVMLAAAPIFNENKVVAISNGASSPKISEAGDYIFRTDVSDNFEGSVMASVAYSKLGFNAISTIFINNEYGVGLKTVFEQEYTKLGGKIMNSLGFVQGATDFRSLVSKITNDNSEAIYIIGYNEMIPLIKQIKEFGIKKQILSTAVLEDPELLSKLGEMSEGIIILSREYDRDREVAQKFLKKFEERFNKKPDFYFAAQAYDAVNLVALTMEKVGFDSEKIKNNLYEIKDFNGVSGQISFDNNGDVIKKLVVKQVSNGKFNKLLGN